MTQKDLGTKFDTSNVTDMGYMFDSCGQNAMTTLNLGDLFDTSKVTSMTYMFEQCGESKLTNLDLGDKFDTSNVTDMSSMFAHCGYGAMTSLNLGDKFDTSNVTNMQRMFFNCGYNEMTTLTLGDKFNTSKVTNMNEMFYGCGNKKLTSLDLGDLFSTTQVTDMRRMFHSCGATAMTTLDLGPAFTKIATGTVVGEDETYEASEDFATDCGTTGATIYAPEAIYNDLNNFKAGSDSTTTMNYAKGTINPKYRTEWQKEQSEIDETDANNPKINITLRGTTNPEVPVDEYISDVTSSLAQDDIKVFIEDTEITDVVTKTIGTATQTANTRTGAKDVLQVLTLSNFEEATRRTGKDFKEWSGNIRIEVAQGTLSDTTGPADAEGNRITYGNKNMDLAEGGARQDNGIEETTKVDKNTDNVMFTDFIDPEFTYESAKTEIIHGDEEQVTIVFDVVDKFFQSTTLSNLDASQITINIDDYDVTALNNAITKQLTKP